MVLRPSQENLQASAGPNAPEPPMPPEAQEFFARVFRRQAERPQREREAASSEEAA